MAFVHHTMLTAENLRGLPSKQLHTNVEPHYSPRSRAAPLRQANHAPSPSEWGTKMRLAL